MGRLRRTGFLILAGVGIFSRDEDPLGRAAAVGTGIAELDGSVTQIVQLGLYILDGGKEGAKGRRQVIVPFLVVADIDGHPLIGLHQLGTDIYFGIDISLVVILGAQEALFLAF